jgi:hypothetical protein
MLSLNQTKKLLHILIDSNIVNENTESDILNNKSILDIEMDISINFSKGIASKLISKINEIVINEDPYISIAKIINQQVVSQNFEKEKEYVFGLASNDFIKHSKQFGEKSEKKLELLEETRNKNIKEHDKKIRELSIDYKNLKKKRKELFKARKQHKNQKQHLK